MSKSKLSTHSKYMSGSMSFEMNRGLKGIEEDILNKNPVNLIPEAEVAGEPGKKAYDDDAYFQSLLKTIGENKNIIRNQNEGTGFQEYETPANQDFDDTNKDQVAEDKEVNDEADETPPEKVENTVTNVENEIPTENEKEADNNEEYEIPAGNGNKETDEYEIPEVIENEGNNEVYDTSKEKNVGEVNEESSKPISEEENEANQDSSRAPEEKEKDAYTYYEENPKASKSSSESRSTEEKKSTSESY